MKPNLNSTVLDLPAEANAEGTQATATSFKSVDQQISEVLAGCERSGEVALKKRAELDAWLATQPQAIECQRHRRPLRIDADESSRLSWERGKRTVAYVPCPDCVDAHRRAERNERFAEMGIPAKFLGATLNDMIYDTEACRVNLEHCRQYAAAPRGFLVLLGTQGNGKTHIGAAILQQHGRGLFVTQSTLLRLHRATYGNSLAPDIRGRCIGTPLLVLDEVGVSVGGKDEGPLLYDILNARYADLRPTIITSNLRPPELLAALGERIVDRLREAAFGIFLFEEPSRRRQANVDYLR